MINQFVNVILTGIDVVGGIAEAIKNVADATGSFIKYKRSDTVNKSGAQIYSNIKQAEQVIYQTNNFYSEEPLKLSLNTLNQILSDPSQFGLEQLAILKNISKDHYGRFYKPHDLHVPVILPSANEYFIGMMPFPTARYAIFNSIRNNYNINVLKCLNFSLHHPDLVQYPDFCALPKFEQIYFGDLYKDYRSLKNLVGSTSIKTFDQFIRPLYQQKIDLETNGGWDYVLFQLTTRRKKGNITVGTIPIKFKS